MEFRLCRSRNGTHGSWAVMVVLTVTLASGVGRMTGVVVAQVERPLTFYRICNIVSGQDDAAAALAREMVELVSRRYPDAKMAASQGRWMTGSQTMAHPVNQILFTEEHRNLEEQQDFTEALLADDDFQALQRKTRGLVDVGSCVDTQFRASP